MIDLKIVCGDVKYMPSYANDSDACLDLKIRINGRNCYLSPHETKIFKTGIKVAIPEGYVMMIFPRSSTGVKRKCRLMNGTGIIDAGFRDEISLPIHNFGSTSVEFQDGERIAQFMIIPRPKINLIEVQDNAEFRHGDRGGGIGSTGNK